MKCCQFFLVSNKEALTIDVCRGFSGRKILYFSEMSLQLEEAKINYE